MPAPPSPLAFAAWDPYLSITRPHVTLRAGVIPGRGYMLTLTDAQGRTISTPTISAEEISHAIAGEYVLVRNGGFAVEFTPVEGVIHVIGGPLAGLRLSAAFAPEVLRAAVSGAGPA